MAVILFRLVRPPVWLGGIAAYGIGAVLALMAMFGGIAALALGRHE